MSGRAAPEGDGTDQRRIWTEPTTPKIPACAGMTVWAADAARILDADGVWNR
ncbi:MAG: hypothetical protein OXT69_13655 [Candidatus Poribacteria bacterium]|nr:hypothetical protein [Candidatus Poribacteria bacterium]